MDKQSETEKVFQEEDDSKLIDTTCLWRVQPVAMELKTTFSIKFWCFYHPYSLLTTCFRYHNLTVNKYYTLCSDFLTAGWYKYSCGTMVANIYDCYAGIARTLLSSKRGMNYFSGQTGTIKLIWRSVDNTRQWTGSALIQVVAWCLFGTEPLSETMQPCYQLDPCEKTSVIFK